MSNMFNIEENKNENESHDSLSYLKKRKYTEFTKNNEIITPISIKRKRGLTV